MRLLKYTFFFLTALLLGIGFYYVLPRDNHLDLTFHTAEGNRIVRECEINWNHLNQLDSLPFEYDFTVINQHGQVLYRTAYDISDTINSAVKNHDTILDIILQNESVGKVIISSNYNDAIMDYKDNLNLKILILSFLLFMIFILYFTLLQRVIFKPFQKLQDFASHIAAGKLDSPLKMDRQHLFGAFTESFDIMREELHAARQREIKANESKKELVAALSHDIKTPVTSIKLISELLLATVTEEQLQLKLHSIYDKAEQINHLVTDMFHATLEELGELRVTVSEEPSTCLTQIIQSADYFDRITMEQVPECLILIDPLRLEQVINNIISNSYKYADTAISIFFQLSEDSLLLNIKDFGLGVREEELPKIFLKFYRGKDEKVQKQSGSGLGLSISKYLMNQMGGEILCSNLEDGFLTALKLKLV